MQNRINANCFTAICSNFSKRRLPCFLRKSKEVQESAPLAGTELDMQALKMLTESNITINTMERGAQNTGEKSITILHSPQDSARGEGSEIPSEARGNAQGFENKSDAFDQFDVPKMTADASHAVSNENKANDTTDPSASIKEQAIIVKRSGKVNALDKLVYETQVNFLASPNNLNRLPKYMRKLVVMNYLKLHKKSLRPQRHTLVQVPRLILNVTENNIVAKNTAAGRLQLSKAKNKKKNRAPTIAWAAFGYYKPKPKKGESITMIDSITKAVYQYKRKTVECLLKKFVAKLKMLNATLFLKN